MPATKTLRKMDAHERDLAVAHMDAARRAARNLRHHANASDVDDLFATAMLGLCKAAMEGDAGQQGCEGYWYRAAENRAKDFLRTTRRPKVMALRVAASLSEHPGLAAAPEDPAEDVPHDEELNRLREAIEALPEPLRCVIRMRMDDVSLREIRLRLGGMSHTAVLRRERKAHALLRAALGEAE